MKMCKTCEQLLKERRALPRYHSADPDFGAKLEMSNKRVVAHNLIKHFDATVELLKPKPYTGPLAALCEALDPGFDREWVEKVLRQTRDDLVRELKL